MVTKINLLPPEIRQKDRADRIVVYMFLSLIVLVFALFGVRTLRETQIDEARAKLSEVQNQTILVNKSISNMKVYEDREKELKRLEGILNQAMADSTIWSRVLNDISLTTPNDVVVRQLSGNAEGISFKADVYLIGTGVSSGHKPVAKWLMRLSENGVFKYVWLTSSSKEDNHYVVDAKAMFKPKDAAPKAPSVPPVKK
ncbi:MAG: PilN domain-containing protein [Candidatus Aquicultorales bacterium]